MAEHQHILQEKARQVSGSELQKLIIKNNKNERKPWLISSCSIDLSPLFKSTHCTYEGIISCSKSLELH